MAKKLLKIKGKQKIVENLKNIGKARSNKINFKN